MLVGGGELGINQWAGFGARRRPRGSPRVNTIVGLHSVSFSCVMAPSRSPVEKEGLGEAFQADRAWMGMET